MEWKEDYSVGIPEIDNEHRLLVRCLTDMENALGKGEPPDAVEAALDRFILSINVHFPAEELLMWELKYPHFAAHRREHQAFLAEIGTIKAGSSATPICSETVTLLRRSLEKHFVADEKDYGVFFRSRKSIPLR